MARLNRLVRESLEKPDDAELRFEIGAILFKYGSPEDAARWMRAALELDPDHTGAHLALAAYFDSRHDWANARLHRQSAGPAPQQP